MSTSATPSRPRRPAPKPAPRRPASIATAAEHYDVTTRTIRRWIADGKLPAWQVAGRLIRVDLDDVDALARPVPAAGSGTA